MMLLAEGVGELVPWLAKVRYLGGKWKSLPVGTVAGMGGKKGTNVQIQCLLYQSSQVFLLNDASFLDLRRSRRLRKQTLRFKDRKRPKAEGW